MPQLQPAPDDERAGDVESRFDAIGNEDIGVTEYAAENFATAKIEFTTMPKRATRAAVCQADEVIPQATDAFADCLRRLEDAGARTS